MLKFSKKKKIENSETLKKAIPNMQHKWKNYRNLCKDLKAFDLCNYLSKLRKQPPGIYYYQKFRIIYRKTSVPKSYINYC